MSRILARRVIPADRAETLPREVERALILSLRTEMREKGIRPEDYQLEATLDPAAGTYTLAAHEVDWLTRPLEFDDRGII